MEDFLFVNCEILVLTVVKREQYPTPLPLCLRSKKSSDECLDMQKQLN